MKDRSFRFTHAICREPGRSVAQGLRASDAGDPDPALFRQEHATYVTELQAAGVDVTVLPALEAFPDSVFVEDSALVLGGNAIQLRPGAPSRLGEAQAIRSDLERLTRGVIDLPGNGYVDGGDILCSDTEVMVGLSARTDRAGADALAPIVAELGYRLRIVETPPEILHFKTESSLLDGGTILATPRLAATGVFRNYRVISTGKGEEAAANAIRVNDRVFLAQGFPRTAETLVRSGYHVVTLPVTQAARVDGGLSCMSLRYAM